MHILVIRVFLYLICGIILLVFSIILMIVNIGTGWLIFIGASIIMIILNKLLKARVSMYYASLEMSQETFKSNDTWLTFCYTYHIWDFYNQSTNIAAIRTNSAWPFAQPILWLKIFHSVLTNLSSLLIIKKLE